MPLHPQAQVMEYRVELFMVDYGTHSIGWESVERRPYKRAEKWMNELAREGWVLDRFEPRSPTELYVVMARRGEASATA